MGNFTEDLAKGFVRSAVNQVGRDGGKVISNSIYGNAHSTPIRGIGKNTHNQFFDESTNEVISPEELRLRAEAEGFQVSLFRYNAGIKIVLYIVSLFFAILVVPSIIIFIFGIMKFFQKTVFMKKSVLVAQFVPDRRYKDGRRLNGHIKQDIRIKVPCNPSERKSLIKAGILYILLSLFLLVPIFLWRSVVEQQNIEYYKDIIENAETEKSHIKEDFELFKDTVRYNKKINEFNEKYQKAVEYLNSHNQTKSDN